MHFNITTLHVQIQDGTIGKKRDMTEVQCPQNWIGFSHVLYLDEVTLISRDTISSMRVLRGLAVEGDVVESISPIGAAVRNRTKVLVHEEGFTTAEGENDGVVCACADCEDSTRILTLESKGICDNVALVWVRTASRWKEAVSRAVDCTQVRLATF